MKNLSTNSSPVRARGRRGYLLLGVIFSVAMVGAVLVGQPAAMATAKPSAVVKMQDKPPKYLPSKVTIKVGQTVEWTNNAKTLHSVTANPATVQNPKDVILPKGAKPFDSGFMPPGATFEHTFTVAGTYQYVCVPHEKDGMKGTVIVKK